MTTGSFFRAGTSIGVLLLSFVLCAGAEAARSEPAAQATQATTPAPIQPRVTPGQRLQTDNLTQQRLRAATDTQITDYRTTLTMLMQGRRLVGRSETRQVVAYASRLEQALRRLDGRALALSMQTDIATLAVSNRVFQERVVRFIRDQKSADEALRQVQSGTVDMMAFASGLGFDSTLQAASETAQMSGAELLTWFTEKVLDDPRDQARAAVDYLVGAVSGTLSDMSQSVDNDTQQSEDCRGPGGALIDKVGTIKGAIQAAVVAIITTVKEKVGAIAGKTQERIVAIVRGTIGVVKEKAVGLVRKGGKIVEAVADKAGDTKDAVQEKVVDAVDRVGTCIAQAKARLADCDNLANPVAKAACVIAAGKGVAACLK